MALVIEGRELSAVGTVAIHGESADYEVYELESRGKRYHFQWVAGASRYLLYCVSDDWWDFFHSLERAVQTINTMEQQSDVRARVRIPVHAQM
jgi:hypothetical protein